MRQQHNDPTPSSEFIEMCSSDFPLKSRSAEYALRYLPVSDLLGLPTNFYFEIITAKEAFKIAEQLHSRFSDSASADKFKESIEENAIGDNLAEAVITFIECMASKKYRVFRALIIPQLEKMIRNDDPSYHHRTEQMCRKLNLSKAEFSMVELSCCCDLNSTLKTMLDSYNMLETPGILSRLLNVSRSEANKFISCAGKLEKNELLLFSRRGSVAVTNSVFDFLIGNSGSDFAADAFKPIQAAELSLEHFDLKPVQKKMLTGILNFPSPNHILFYGKAGTGKTELAKVLAQKSGKKAVVVNYGSDGDARDRKAALIATMNSVPENTLIVVDEVDGLLNTQSLFRAASVNKGWINQFLDECRHKMIWIVNESGGMEESVRRRFAYSLQFKQLTWRQREMIWLTQLRKNRIKRFFQTVEIQQLAKRFPVSPGLIAYSIKTVKQCRTPNMSTSEIHAMLNEVLTRQMELTEGRKPEKKLNGINENYDPDALNTDTNIPRLLQGLENFQTSETGYGINLLFWGWPGTGKTEFGKHIAERLGKELLVKRMSDLQSKWVGETEKQIAAAFREAEENDAILFLDEADSLFINRQTANRSWETSQTNEILTQMENFSGILVCCTNLLENLDEATLRRFAFKVKFLPLTAEGKQLLYRKYFSSRSGSLTSELEIRLSNIRNLCPGDIKAVWQRVRMMSKVKSLPHIEIITELEKEVSYKKGSSTPIGFTQ